MLVYCCTWKTIGSYTKFRARFVRGGSDFSSRQDDNNNTGRKSYQFGIPPTNTSELVANFPKWNSLPRDVRI